MSKNSKGFAHLVLIIGIVLVGIVGIGYLILKNNQTSTTEETTSVVYSTQEECEEKTGKTCDFQNCDYVPPEQTFEEVCGKDFKKGWAPTEKTTTSSDTSDWKTYRNTKYGYTLNYPPDWEVKAATGYVDINTFAAPYFDSPCDYQGGQRCSKILVKSMRTTDEVKLEDYIKLNTSGKWPDRLIRKENARLDGEIAIKLEYFIGNYGYESGRGLVSVSIVAEHNDLAYRIDYSERGKDQAQIKSSEDWENPEIFDQIISTFRFSDIDPDTRCVIGGCNNEICAEEKMSSVCVYKEEFACYKNATCEIQEDGKCGWTQTEELLSCLES